MRTVRDVGVPDNQELVPLPVSPETMKAMWEFFLRTSVPRILESRRLQKEQAQ